MSDPLHVTRHGPPGGPPVLAIHGVTGHGGRWERLAREALPHRRTLAVDLRGHGASTWEPPFTVARHVADLIGVLDAHRVARADLMAHSFGGLLALALAAHAPDRVGRIALLDPAVALAPARARRDAERARRDASWATRAEARAALGAAYTGAARTASDDDVAVHVVRCPDGRLRERYSRPAVVAAWGEMTRPAPRLSADGGPVLLVTARDADVVTDALRAALRRDGVAAEEHVLPGGHRLYWDALAQTAAHLRRFLGAPTPPGVSRPG